MGYPYIVLHIGINHELDIVGRQNEIIPTDEDRDGVDSNVLTSSID